MKNHETTLKNHGTNQKPLKTMKPPWKTMEPTKNHEKPTHLTSFDPKTLRYCLNRPPLIQKRDHHWHEAPTDLLDV